MGSSPSHVLERAGERAGLDAHVLKIAAVVICGAIMSILDATIVNIALEDIASELHAPLSTVQWTVTGYLLALATVIPLSGWMAERFDARLVWMASVGLFVLGSVLCGLAWSPDVLIAFRVLQGLGGGLIMPVGIILLTQAAGPDRMGRVMSVIGVPMLLGPVLGPVIGGLIVEHVSWRWIFYVNVPVGLAAIALAWRMLESGTAGEAGRLDWLGLLLASPGVALVTFGLSESASAGGFGAVQSWGPIVGGLVLLALFIAHALRTENALIDLRLFRRAGFASAAATVAVVGAALFGALILLPLFFQTARGESALDAGLLLTPQGLGAAAMMPIAGSLTDRIGGGRVALGGLVLLTLGTLPFAFVGAHTSLWLLEGGLVVRGLGLGATMMPSMSAAYAALRRDQVPRATSALNVLQRVGGSLGTAVLTVVLHGRLVSALPGDSGSADLGAARSVSGAARDRLAGPLADAFSSTFWWALPLTVAAAIPAFVLAWRGERPQAEGQEEPAREDRDAAARGGGDRRRSAAAAGHPRGRHDGGRAAGQAARGREPASSGRG